MKSMSKLVAISLGCIILLASCTAPPAPALKATGHFTYGIISLDTLINYEMLASSGRVLGFAFDTDGVTKDTIAIGVPSGGSVTGYFIDSIALLPAGNVYFNASSIPMVDSVYTGGAPVYFDGRYQKWSVQGQSPIPSISDSLQGPFDSLVITSPPNAADVYADSGLTISWNAGSSFETTELIISPYATGAGFSDEISGSTSSEIVSPSALSLMPKGRTSISINRGVYKIGIAPNGKSYIMVTWFSSAIDVNLK